MKKIGMLLVPLMIAGLFLALADQADAARFGGGRSFGSKPLFSKPFSKPVSPAQPGIGGQRTTPTQPGFRRPGMGGMLGTMLMGGLIGSLLFGGGFAGVNIMDFLIIGLVIYFAMRLFARGRPQSATDPDREVDPREASEIYRRNQDAWDHLRSKPAPSASHAASHADDVVHERVNLPEGFDLDDFLEGAKMVYARLQESWAARDMEDVRQFTSDAVYREIEDQARQDPTPSPVEVLMINARVLEVKLEGDDLRATVYYDVLLREDERASQPSQVREVWHFTKPAADDHAMWILDGIQQMQ